MTARWRNDISLSAILLTKYRHRDGRRAARCKGHIFFKPLKMGKNSVLRGNLNLFQCFSNSVSAPYKTRLLECKKCVTLYVYPMQAYTTATEIAYFNLRDETPAGQGGDTLNGAECRNTPLFCFRTLSEYLCFTAVKFHEYSYRIRTGDRKRRCGQPCVW